MRPGHSVISDRDGGGGHDGRCQDDGGHHGGHSSGLTLSPGARSSEKVSGYQLFDFY